MRIATFRHDGQVRTGIVDGDQVLPFHGDPTMLEIISAGVDAFGSAQAVPLEKIRLLAPLKPASLRDFVAFEEHVEGVRRSIDGASGVPDAWYAAPTFYFTNPHTILGPDDDVPFPAASVARDFELEVAAVIGPDQRIFGYTIFNDWSARDLQSREMKVSLGPAKGKDFAGTLGPWIVTADELEPHRREGFLELWCTASVNGVEVGRDLLSNMGWTFETMLAYAARDSRVMAGDVLGSGTVGNGGCLAELWGRNGRQDPPPLRDGDTVTLTVEGIGSLTNRIISGPRTAELPPVRRRDPAIARNERQH
ncbi:2-keto-4-pentenoate hydratase/2-oxohepta-3-ene-1,7-dioic acid hydratase in catechol pathway [Actinoplanes campanulatus]|uniref:2-keto-4-pentenoate hydratase/2-oxohepta-3-ene-1,7-dioic acid hydratase in catechol pathway n=1 Tax=Actinoplanes campanulatus TaxID=113559 RepID=A0A7W5AFT6_9ACTN|nr:fumarylacetoacetate hydrolase family protein [Actinoplanes campanulatus]MBB3095418.1 2-keto-4-pentenoate hydratase/2-oxohepta-3-ene-1,7-dioic acid hydratase in catechol pathway [Actinoplanes campanulatus]GGN41980.1 hydroxylase [Actinoplanes campanulatus]GID35021.1 hydroxylase [Actinoplanes campanulatus]